MKLWSLCLVVVGSCLTAACGMPLGEDCEGARCTSEHRRTGSRQQDINIFQEKVQLKPASVHNFKEKVHVAPRQAHLAKDYFVDIKQVQGCVRCVTTLAGSGTSSGYKDGPGLQAQFSAPTGLGIDAKGQLYVGDSGNQNIRKVDMYGNVTTYAGKGAKGVFGNIKLSKTDYLYVDASGSIFHTYYGGGRQHEVYKIDVHGKHSKFGASCSYFEGLAGNHLGNIFVGDHGSIYVYDKDGKRVKNNVGYFRQRVNAIVADTHGTLFFVSSQGKSVYKLDSHGKKVLIAGSGSYGLQDGPGTQASFQRPSGITVDTKGNLYVVDGNARNIIRMIDTKGNVTTIAGSGSTKYVDGAGKKAGFGRIGGIAVDTRGNIFVTDSLHNRVRRIHHR